MFQTPGLRKGLFALLLLLCLPSLTMAQNFRPFTALTVLQTAHFDIIFPEVSRRTALELASMADQEYDKVSTLLGIHVAGHIPVTITPATDEFNGYCSFVPYTHIVLFDTPLSVEWTTFDDSLGKLFTHELTHAVSLSTRSPFYDFLHALFGSWVTPAVLTAPGFMVEGIAVSFESLDGSGRSNDPLVKERVRQVIRENQFLTPFQASGAYDGRHAADASYEYGGLFSTWLQHQFGPEKYAALWQAMGSPGAFSLDYNEAGFYSIFKDVYQETFTKAWADFADNLALRGLVDNPKKPVWQDGRLGALAAASGRLAALETRSGTVIVSEQAQNGKTWVPKQTWMPEQAARDLDISPDGARVLVSGYRYEGSLATATVTEYQDGQPGARWTGLWSARYFRDGVVGLGSDLHNSRIVWRDRTGLEKILVEGSSFRSLSAPAPLDDHRLLFLFTQGGLRHLGLYNFDTGQSFELTGADQWWTYARDLRASGGKVWFAADPDDRTYRPGWIGGEPLTASLSTTEYSGGVHAPVWAGALYYQAVWATTDALLAYPASVDVTKALALVPLAPAPQRSTPVSGQTTTTERPYWGAQWFNPLSLWYPTVQLDLQSAQLRTLGAGISTYLSDPIDQNVVSFSGGWSIDNQPWFDTLWTSSDLGFPLSLAVSDKLEPFGLDYRVWRASISADGETSFGSEAWRLSWRPWASGVLVETTAPVGLYGASLNLSSLSTKVESLFPEGLRLGVSVMGPFVDGGPRWEASAVTGINLWGLRVRAGAYGFSDPAGADIDGTSLLYGYSSFASLAPREYTGQGYDGTWAVGGTVEAQVLKIETQTNLSLIYVNRLFVTTGWRGAVNDQGFLQSVFAQLGAVTTLPIAAMANVRLAPLVGFGYKLGPVPAGQSNLVTNVAVSLDW